LKELSARALRQTSAALIIAGGFGARFWPAARSNRPKPLFSLNGRTSLLDDTIARLVALIAPERVFVLVPTARCCVRQIPVERGNVHGQHRDAGGGN
jgi:mannose-1-phosphate guanylyltransferase